MSEHMTTIAERSEPFIRGLVQNQVEMIQEGVSTTDLIGIFAVPGLVHDPRRVNTQLLFIAGGAASGKSTLAENMASELAGNGTKSAVISSDDFVRWDRAKRHFKETNGMDPEDKYDFIEMRRAINAICGHRRQGHTVEVPQYDSHTGLALNGKHERQIPKVDVLIVEGDMLSEEGAVPQRYYPHHAFKPISMYIHAPDEVRLSRRIERDMLKRNAQGATPEDIARSFEHRQTAQHVPYTLAYAATADIILTPPADQTGPAQTYDMHTMNHI